MRQMTLILTMWAAIHFICVIYAGFRNPTKIDKELVIQHHEKCLCLMLIALAVWLR